MNNPQQSNLIHRCLRRHICAAWLLPLLLLTLPAMVQAQFTYTTNNGAITITGYSGPGGAVTIPSTINGLPVTSIGWGAFISCTSLTSVTIPYSVTSIGGFAFDSCKGLTSVTILDSVTNIGVGAFISCASLAAITVDALNPVYSSMDGVLFNKTQSTLIQCPGGSTGSYAVPNSVSSIGDFAFAGCHSLAGVTIPASVTSLGNYAFNDCTTLTAVTIPNSVTSIEAYAFSYCTSLTSVRIPDSVTNIGGGAFHYCPSLTAITVDALDPVYSSVDGVLLNKTQTTLIQCPGGRIGSYTVPNSVSSIGDYAFSDCYSLTGVTIPASVTSIGDSTFYNCTTLTAITIPNSVTSIGDWAFCYCTSLTSVRIPDSVTNIGRGACYYCTRLAAITVDALNLVYSSVDGVLLNKTQTTLIQCPGGRTGSYTVPNNVSSIGDFAFSGCHSLTGVTIPASVTSIGGYAFIDCTTLTAITIPNSVTSIGDLAFSECTNLTAAYFKGSAPSVGIDVFNADSNVTVYYLPGTTGWGATFGGRPTVLWNLPAIQEPPQTQTAEAGSVVGLRVKASGPLPLFYLWYFNNTNLITCSTNRELELTNLQFAQSGAYSAVVSHALGTVTSAPAMLNVIAPVERRPVPGVKFMGETGSLLNVDYASSLSPAPNWITLDSVSPTSTSQYCFDLTLPFPPQRYYRAWQTGTPGVRPSLDLHLVPAITLTGTIGHSVRLDYIHQFGPTDAWVTLATVTLTNTSQLYFDISAPGKPQRLYRLVPSP